MTGFLKTLGITTCSLLISSGVCDAIDIYAKDEKCNKVIKICAIQTIVLISFAVTKKI